MREIQTKLSRPLSATEVDELWRQLTYWLPHFAAINTTGDDALLQFEFGEHEESEQEFKNAIEIVHKFEPKNSKRELSRDEALAKLEDYQQQINELRAVIEKFS